MYKTIVYIIILLCYSFICSCSKPESGDKTQDNTNSNDTSVSKVPSLCHKENWEIDTIATGAIYYEYEAFDEITKGYQIVHVMEIDLENPNHQLKIYYAKQGDSLSHVMQLNPNAICGINGGYGVNTIYLKINNNVLSEVSLNPTHIRFWKHEAAFCFSGKRKANIFFASKDGLKAIDIYKNSTEENIIASAPMLINNYDLMGEKFVGADYTMEELDKLDPEDFRRHQGIRHPRTAYALTEDNDLLLIAVNGRWPGKAEGMNAAELTKFIAHHFNPQYAINMDGGGSTTLCVKGKGHHETNVVNYPTDKDRYDHTGQRAVSTHLLVIQK